jgi:putative flavoprotein involved in K+ transport
MESIETLVIGAGQAGLATSYFLQQAGREHLVLEQADRATNVWQSGRWDSFCLVTPNWTFRLPGGEYDGAEPDGFMPRSEIIDRFDRYVTQYQLPVQTRTRVQSVESDGKGGYRIVTSNGVLLARNVVVATGWEQQPAIPEAARDVPTGVTQFHSSAYRNPDALPEGAVLVVGSAQSGAQIAEELYQNGRQVYHSISSAGRAPRSYRGRDVVDWLFNSIGFFDLPAEKFPAPIDRFAPPHLSGAQGGHTLNLHQFASDGVSLLGHFRSAADGKAHFAPDMHECLAKADAFEAQVQQMVDGFIAANGLDVPAGELPKLNDGFAQPIVERIDLRAEGITSVIWATGYRHDYRMLKLPVLDQKGMPVQNRGVTNQPGLYFAGMPWMPGLKTGTLMGTGEQARGIAEAIVSHSTPQVPSAVA